MYPNPQAALPLPARPSLEQYRKRAKDLVKACKSGEPAAIRQWTTRWLESLDAQYRQSNTPAEPDALSGIVSEIEQFARKKLTGGNEENRQCSLANAQFVIARAHGFLSWPRFSKHLEALALLVSAESAFEAAADAIVSGDVVTLERLLREKPELIHARSTREHRGTLLHYVSANGVEGYRQKTPKNAVQIAEILLRSGAEVDATADVYGGGCTTLGLVATSAHPRAAGVQLDLIDVLLKHGARTDIQGAGNNHSLVNACLANGCPEAAAYLLSLGAPGDLEAAAGAGRLDIVETYFDDEHSRVSRATQAQVQAALGQACAFGHARIAEFLLTKGADVGATFQIIGGGHTALHAAALGGFVDAVKVLIRSGAPLDVTDSTWGTPPIVWAMHGWGTNRSVPSARYEEVVTLLADAGASVKPEWVQFARDLGAAPDLLLMLRERTDARSNFGD
jgi:ankyrin repeat protein